MAGGYISCGSFMGADKSGSAFQGLLEAVAQYLPAEESRQFRGTVIDPVLGRGYSDEKMLTIPVDVVPLLLPACQVEQDTTVGCGIPYYGHRKKGEREMRTDQQLCDFFAELCRRAKEKYGLPPDGRSWEQLEDLEAVREGMRQDAEAAAEELTDQEKDRLSELVIAIMKAGNSYANRQIAHFVAYDYLPKYAVWWCILLDDMLQHGPRHFREQSEAKIANIFGEKFAAYMCGMKGKESTSD